MGLSLLVKANDTAKVQLYHPDTRESLGTLIIAGPNHEATKAWEREINDRRQKRNYRRDADAETKEGLCRRTVGWEGVKNAETGEDAPFDTNLLPELFEQDWLLVQALSSIGEENFFFRK